MANSNGVILEHRLVMSEHLGRMLSSKEVVHHKNGNKQDNRVENLEVISAADHVGIHKVPKEYLVLKCSFCGKEYKAEARNIRSRKKNGAKKNYCSKECVGRGCGRNRKPD